MPDALRGALAEFSSPRMLATIERITGISSLIPDPYLDGGGLHLSLEGGVLVPHTDFHVYERLNLFRRINLILYLNTDWPATGGALQLFDDQGALRESVRPVMGRCVIFETDDRSIHGFTDPVPPGRRRRSIAVYYYTARDVDRFVGDTTTNWVRHGGGGLRRGAQLTLSRAFARVARMASVVAYRVDPNRDR
jgi:Rps23 Pro-64 3,4-dihydroxylase Tpa1-like proline 4-hydroxylase